MKRRTLPLAILLITAILAFLFSGCNGQKEQEADKAETTTASSNTTETSKEPPRKVTVYATRCANDSSPLDSTDNAEVWQKIHDEFLAETNIDLDLKVEFMLWQEAQNKLQMKFAANDRLDIFATAEYWMNSWTKGDMGPFRSIDAEIEKYGTNMKKMLDPLLFKLVTKHGHVVALPTDGVAWNYAVMIRKDIVEKLGVKWPTNLQEFEEVLKAMKTAYPDSIPIASPSNQIQFAGELFIGANPAGIGWVYDKEKDKFGSWTVTPDYVEYHDFTGRWIKNGWLSKDHAQHKFEDVKKMIFTNKSFVYVSGASELDEINRELKKNDPNAELAPLINGTDIHGRPFKLKWNNPTVVRYGVYKNANPESVEAFVRYYDWSMDSTKNYHLTTYGIEGKHFTVSNGKLIIPEELKDKNYYKALYGFFSTGNIPGYSLYPDYTLDSSLKYYEELNKAPKHDGTAALFALGDIGPIATDWGNAWTKYIEKMTQLQMGMITREEAEKAQQDLLSSDIYKKVDEEINRQLHEQKAALGIK